MKLWYDRKSKNPTYFVQLGIRNGKKTTTKNIARIGRHSDLLKITDDPLSYAKGQVAKYNEEAKLNNQVSLELKINFAEKLKASDSTASSSKQLNIGYFFLQQLYHDLEIGSFFDSITAGSKITFDPNLVNRFLTCDRILAPDSKLGSLQHMANYYEQPQFDYMHIMRTMDLMADHYDEYISHLFEKSNNIIKRDISVCFYDCTNYYFEIETEDDDYVDEVTGETIKGMRKFGHSKEHRPNPIVEMGLFMDTDGIPLSMCITSGSDNEQTTVIPLEKKLSQMFQKKKFIYCADAGLGSLNIRNFNSMGGRAFIVTQSIKKLPAEDRTWALNGTGFKRLSDDTFVDITSLSEDDKDQLYYKDEPFTAKKLHQRLIITYSSKYAAYQKAIRAEQISRAEKMAAKGSLKRQRKNPNDPARFVNKAAVTKEGEKAKIHYHLDLDKIAEKEKYDGLCAVCTDLLDDDVTDILKVSEGRLRTALGP